ncbi:hypothetical protein BTU51_1390 [Rickettsia rickettsii]|uniref:Uncharacterized protein n=1 Tax=Rickettsia rickettsii (strain Iowa) TaxID=452659 RepID=B0BV64_RICRO|nr:hypothetical protein RrIowa_1390 [Rickettsia rickettsii str. Iowa]APU56074.1 hypothetical protein BTU50_1390 [Rickettsia rickettsii]APU57451.1 hypothetical protein BTU51_1390 [Rickettsia rickettsii]
MVPYVISYLIRVLLNLSFSRTMGLLTSNLISFKISFVNSPRLIQLVT